MADLRRVAVDEKFDKPMAAGVKKKHDSAAAAAKKVKGKGKKDGGGRGGGPPSPTPKSKAKPTDVCSHCGRKGHWKKECWFKDTPKGQVPALLQAKGLAKRGKAGAAQGHGARRGQ